MTCERITIKSHGVPIERAMKMVNEVMSMGKVSETRGIAHWCFVSTFNDGSSVYCYLTRANRVVFDVRIGNEKKEA